MEATATVPAAPAAPEFRARLHQIIDQIQDPELLRVVWQLLAPQVLAPAEAEPEPKLSAEWRAQLEAGIKELDEGKGIPAAEVFAQLLAKATA